MDSQEMKNIIQENMKLFYEKFAATNSIDELVICAKAITEIVTNYCDREDCEEEKEILKCVFLKLDNIVKKGKTIKDMYDCNNLMRTIRNLKKAIETPDFWSC